MRARAMMVGVIALIAGATSTSCRAVGGLGDLRFDGGAGGAGGSGVTSSTTTSSSAFDAGVEHCTNGVDDDGDDLADCADPDCGDAGYACAGAVPPAWTGPLAVYDGAGPLPSACPSAFPQAVFDGGKNPVGAPAMCEPCVCQTAAAACSDAEIELYPDTECLGGPTTLTLSSDVCTALALPLKRVILLPSTPLAGACAPLGGAASVPPIGWDSEALACGGATLGGGCAGGLVCAPRAPPPFGATWCVAREGDASCPKDYPDKRLRRAVMDERGCGACVCGDPPCDATAALFGDTSCTNMVGSAAVAGACTKADNADTTMLTVSPGSCVVSGGGEPSGSLHETAWTICCAL